MFHLWPIKCHVMVHLPARAAPESKTQHQAFFFFGVVVGVAVDLFFFRLHMFICKWVGLADWHMMAVTWKLAVDDWWLVQLNYLVKMAAHLRGFFCLADLIYSSFFIYYYTFTHTNIFFCGDLSQILFIENFSKNISKAYLAVII